MKISIRLNTEATFKFSIKSFIHNKDVKWLHKYYSEFFILKIFRKLPIKFLVNYSFFSGKYIFIGESAHVLHPVGGQGLNLCWRDVDCLTKIISKPLFKNHHSIIPIISSDFITLLLSYHLLLNLSCYIFQNLHRVIIQ